MKQENQDMANWANEHKKWRNSGQEQKSYCKKEGLLLSKFKLGVKKASAAGLLYKKTKPNMNGEASLFKRINLEPSVARIEEARPGYCEIWFEGKLSIRIETEESLGRLGDLIKGLVR